MEALGLLADADADSEESRGAFVRYVIAVMCFSASLAHSGAYLSLLRVVQKVLEALEPSRIDDPLSL